MNHLFLAVYLLDILGSVALAVVLGVHGRHERSRSTLTLSALFGAISGFLLLWFVAGYTSVNLLGRETPAVQLVESAAYLFVCAAEALLA
ncbi:hypothetical protein, partial [Salinispira pacifica]